MCVFKRPFLDKTKLIFIWGGGVKGQVKWPLTLLIVFFAFLGVVFLVFESPSFFLFFLLCFHEKEQHLTIELQCFFSHQSLVFFFFFLVSVFVCL